MRKKNLCLVCKNFKFVGNNYYCGDPDVPVTLRAKSINAFEIVKDCMYCVVKDSDDVPVRGFIEYIKGVKK